MRRFETPLTWKDDPTTPLDELLEDRTQDEVGCHIVPLCNQVSSKITSTLSKEDVHVLTMELVNIRISLNSDLGASTTEDDVFHRGGAFYESTSLFEGVFESV